MPVIDLLPSRLSNQIIKYFAWTPDQHSSAMDAVEEEQSLEILFELLLFSLTQTVACKINKEKVDTVIFITSESGSKT